MKAPTETPAAIPGPPSDAEHARLAWQCRRGMRELDEILLGFLRRGYAGLDAAGRQCFDELLRWPDPLILPWLLGQSTPADPGLARLVAIIRRSQAGT